MREVVFQVLSDRAGELVAIAHTPSLRITAASFEELQHEARDALMHHLGPAHAAYRVRIRRQSSAVAHGIHPLRRQGLPCH
mgnify:CR=1 FL=1